SASVTCTCSASAGNVGRCSEDLRSDASASSVTVSAGRAADHNGWYNAPVVLSAAGTDATSGLESCQADVNYSGPDDGSASVTRTDRESAGYVRTGSKGFKHDAAAEEVTAAAGR